MLRRLIRAAVVVALAVITFPACAWGHTQNFIIASDVHVGFAGVESWNPLGRTMVDEAPAIFERMLRDDADITKILVVGDVTANGTQQEWEAYRGVLAATGALDRTVTAMGNHEVYVDPRLDIDKAQQEFSRQVDLFKAFAGVQSAYYDVWLGEDVHVLCLARDVWGNDAGLTWHYANYSQEQLAWLEDNLTVDERSGVVDIVLMHHPQAHVFDDSEYSPQWAQLGTIIAKHGNAIVASAHTHRDFHDGNNVRLDAGGSLYVHDGAVLGPRYGEHMGHTMYVRASEIGSGEFKLGLHDATCNEIVDTVYWSSASRRSAYGRAALGPVSLEGKLSTLPLRGLDK